MSGTPRTASPAAEEAGATVSDPSGLAALQPAWDALFAAQPMAHLASTFAMVYATATQAHDAGSWRCHLQRTAGRLGGALYGRRTFLTPFGLRIPIFNAGTEFASDPLLHPQMPQAAGELLEQVLDAEADCALLQFGRLTEPALALLRDAAVARGLSCAVALAPYGYAWDASAGSPALEARLGSSTRQLMRRTERKFEKSFRTGFVKLASRDVATNLELLGRFIEMEAAGWKGREGTAIGLRPGNAEYFRAIIEAGAGGGLVEWYTLEADGQAIAMYLCMRTHDTLWIPKIAFDERFGEYRPGQELLRRVLLDCLADPATNTVNFIGAPDWLDNWRLSRQDCYELRVFSRSWRGHAVAAMDRARKALRSGAAREAAAAAERERRFL